MRVLLASASPRRRELMGKLVPSFDVRAFPADEHYTANTPEKTVAGIAERKLEAASSAFGEYDAVVACDTLVYMDGKYYGKPTDEKDAERMLSELSGKTHTVYSGVAVYKGGKRETRVAATNVTFKRLGLEEIREYISSHPVLDKAGAYAVQDGVVVEKYDGSYTNIVGLPLETLADML